MSAYTNPSSFGDFQGINKIVWIFCHLFVDTKFISIFSMLFGAGIVLLADRFERLGTNTNKAFQKRMFWLAVIGFLHSYLFWYGDILFSYAICGLIAFKFRSQSIKQLWVTGLIFIIIGALALHLLQLSFSQLTMADMQSLKADWSPDLATIEYEIKQYQQGWLSLIGYRSGITFYMQTSTFLIYTFWRTTGLMLIGMALLKQGLFTNTPKIQVTIPLAVTGLSLTAYGIYFNFSHEWNIYFSMAAGFLFNYYGSLLLALSYIFLFTSIASTTIGKLFIPAGKMALSNYLAQTLICSWIFYGYGLGLFATLDRWQQFLLALVIGTFQLFISRFWLKHFKAGPAEAIWRKLALLK